MLRKMIRALLLSLLFVNPLTAQTEGENQAPFIAGQLAMMIAHPSDYAKMVDLASKATGGQGGGG